MCRLAAYMGRAIPLSAFLAEPEHSLVKQSWAPREMKEAALNADGFGFGWYADDGAPAVYTNTCPIWNDPNLPALGRSLSRPIWMANTRSATPGQEIGHGNTQPFAADRVLFLHNGYIESFRAGTRVAFHHHLSPDIQAGIQGNTDSEFLFALLRQCLDETKGGIEAALRALLEVLPRLIDGRRALLNIVICDGERLVGCRHALNGGECPSLYAAVNAPAWPGATIIASEAFSGEGWQPIAPHTLFTADAAGFKTSVPL